MTDIFMTSDDQLLKAADISGVDFSAAAIAPSVMTGEPCDC